MSPPLDVSVNGKVEEALTLLKELQSSPGGSEQLGGQIRHIEQAVALARSRGSEELLEPSDLFNTHSVY